MLASVVASPAVLAGCNFTTASVLNTQVLASAKAAVSETGTIVSILHTAMPNVLVLDQITVAQQVAASLLDTLTTTTPAAAGATTLQKVEAAINTILDLSRPVLQAAATTDPVLAPAIVAYDVIVPLVPAIEAWINQTLVPATPTTTIPHVAARVLRMPLHTVYTVDQALAHATLLRAGLIR
jgi:hypothetical protein